MKDMKQVLEKLGKLKSFGDKVSFRPKWRNLFFLMIIFLLVFLLSNIYSSQKISSLFFSLINNDRKSVIEFLQKIRQMPYFPQQLKYYENIYGPPLKTEVFAEELEREVEITKLEQILEKNHQSRDILYGLFLLYKEKGNSLKAEKYLKLAKEVDPTIK